MEPLAGVADNISLAALRINDTRVFYRFINIFISITDAKHIILAQLPFRANRKLGLLEGIKFGIDRSIQKCRGARFVGIYPKILLTSASDARSNKTCLRTNARSGKTANDIIDVKARRRFAGENFEIIFKKNITAEQTARKSKFYPVVELTVAGENLCLAVAGNIKRKTETRRDLVAPAEVDRAWILVKRW